MKKTNINKTLSALDFALSQLVDEPQHADEFSAEDAYVEARKKNPKLTLSSVRQKLMRMEQNGALKKRTMRHNGTTINLYSKA
jgi:Fe2+ or Zn2+ uptake regulation protein